MTKQDTPSEEGPVFTIQRIYIKDSSFEAPGSPQVFREEWKPEVNVDLQNQTSNLEEGVYEVILHLTVTTKMADNTAFLVEVKQAGIFTLQGFPEDHLNHALGSMCPNILYPYAREAVSNAVSQGGFPQLLLAPVNFDALYMQHLEEQKSKSPETVN